MRYNPLTNLAVHFKKNTAQEDATDLTLVYVLWVALNIAWPQIECNFFLWLQKLKIRSALEMSQIKLINFNYWKWSLTMS